MPQDQLFKELLQAFFREFLELFYPAIAARLDFQRVTFLDKEAFADVPEGSRREADLVAQVHTLEGEPELLLFHFEVQTQRRREMPYRMFEYYALLRLRRRLPVLPIVVYLAPGAGGLVQEGYTESLFDTEILTFRYNVVGLPDLSAANYLDLDNPLGPTLSALMHSDEGSRVVRRLASMQKRSLLLTDDARRSLLLNIIERYLPLNAAEEAELQERIAQPELREVRDVITSYEERGIEQGIRQGILRGKHQAVLLVVRSRFGEVPEAVVSQIEAVTEATELDTLLQRALTAADAQDLLRPA